MRENTDQKNSEFGHFSRSVCLDNTKYLWVLKTKHISSCFSEHQFFCFKLPVCYLDFKSSMIKKLIYEAVKTIFEIYANVTMRHHNNFTMSLLALTFER